MVRQLSDGLELLLYNPKMQGEIIKSTAQEIVVKDYPARPADCDGGFTVRLSMLREVPAVSHTRPRVKDYAVLGRKWLWVQYGTCPICPARISAYQKSVTRTMFH